MKTQMKTSARPDFLQGVMSGLWPDGRGTASTLHFLQESRMIEVGTMRVREAVCTGEKSDARANGFSPRLLALWGKHWSADSLSALEFKLQLDATLSAFLRQNLFLFKEWPRHLRKQQFLLFR